MVRVPSGARVARLHLLLSHLLPLLLLPTSSSAAEAPRWGNWTFTNFTNDFRANLSFLGDSDVAQGALQLTPDSINNPQQYLVNKSGRIIFSNRIKIWEDAPHNSEFNSSVSTVKGNETSPKTVISFWSVFDFNIFRSADWPEAGEGLAFIVTGSNTNMPSDSYGQYLGLTNASTDGNATNEIVAVEFDTLKQAEHDPDGNHIGLDINSVVSKVSRSLNDSNINIAPLNGSSHRAWIYYNGTERHIYVYVAPEGKPKPSTPMLNASVDLSAHLPQYAYFGFAGSTGNKYELNCILAWNLTAEILPEDESRSPGWWILRVGLPVLAVVLIAVIAVVAWQVSAERRKVRNRDERLLGTLKSLPGTPREFEYKELKRATNNFDEKNKLGQGGFGVVYRGIIPGEKLEVAVKSFSRQTMEGDFLAELTIINRLRHKHLVRLLGWCHKNGKLLIVYDYMPKGSLDEHLFNAPPGDHLPWECRYRILTGVASALHYLHNEYDQMVVHRDLKASNIMLDSEFNARLGDFGLARTIDNEHKSYAAVELSRVQGTPGYIAPECFHTGKATRESDVFGFGVVVLEVICGRRTHCDVGGFSFLADWVWDLHRLGTILDAVDQNLGSSYEAEEAQRMLLLGLACSQPNPGDRPKTYQILQVISGAVPPPEVPLFKPSFVWPSANVSFQGMDGETTTTSASSNTVEGTSSLYSSAYTHTPHFASRDSVIDISN